MEARAPARQRRLRRSAPTRARLRDPLAPADRRRRFGVRRAAVHARGAARPHGGRDARRDAAVGRRLAAGAVFAGRPRARERRRSPRTCCSSRARRGSPRWCRTPPTSSRCSTPTRRCRYASPSAARVLGFEPDAIEGTRFSDLIHPDDMTRVLAVPHVARRGGGPHRDSSSSACATATATYLHGRDPADQPAARPQRAAASC